MDRLTIRNSDGTVSQPLDLRWADALERLAAYEDTGLEPEEIEKTMSDCAYVVISNQFAIKDINELGGIDHLRELVQAGLDGRLVVLPCKVGSKVYARTGIFYLPPKVYGSYDIITAEVIVIKATKKGRYILLKPTIEEVCGKRSSQQWVPFSAFGKTVFLTREEAEAALTKM